MTKIVYLVRHGEDGVDGSLTPEGVKQITATAKQIQRELGSLDGVVIYHSTIKRAAESAYVMSKVMGGVSTVPRTELNLDFLMVGRVINEIEEGRAILISHEPDLEDYMERQGRPDATFRNGQAYRLDL